MPLREAIAGVIAGHQFIEPVDDGPDGCDCGWKGKSHPKHLADAICASPDVREAMERATSEWVDGDDRWLPNGRSLADAILGPASGGEGL